MITVIVLIVLMTILELNVESNPDHGKSHKFREFLGRNCLMSSWWFSCVMLKVAGIVHRPEMSEDTLIDIHELFGQWCEVDILESHIPGIMCQRYKKGQLRCRDTTRCAHSWERLHHYMWGRIHDCYDFITRDSQPQWWRILISLFIGWEWTRFSMSISKTSKAVSWLSKLDEALSQKDHLSQGNLDWFQMRQPCHQLVWCGKTCGVSVWQEW